MFITPLKYFDKCRLPVFDSDIYIGSFVQNYGTLGIEIHQRIRRVTKAYSGLELRDWRQQHINNNTNKALYKSFVLSCTIVKHRLVMNGILNCSNNATKGDFIVF